MSRGRSIVFDYPAYQAFLDGTETEFTAKSDHPERVRHRFIKWARKNGKLIETHVTGSTVRIVYHGNLYVR